MVDEPMSEDELERRLREGETSDDELPEPPDYPDEIPDDPRVTWKDENPEEYSRLMQEGASTEGVAQPSGSDPLERIERLLADLPDRMATRFGVD